MSEELKQLLAEKGWEVYRDKAGWWYVKPLYGTRMFKGYASADEAVKVAIEVTGLSIASQIRGCEG